MPEGPEVKLFVDALNNKYKNKKVLKVEVLSGRYIKKPIQNINTLSGKTINSFNCKGKFIWIDFSEVFAFNTLGMTGSWNDKKTKHSRIEISFEDNEKIYFNDIRNFGTFQLKNNKELERKLKSIGPDMLSSPPDDFVSRLRKHNNKNICEVLMNQKIISGVGNYIKAECLWYSRINPYSKIKDLTDKNLLILEKAVLFVINKSYEEQGASIQSYYTFNGDTGSATQGFVVYGKKNDYNGHQVLKEQTPDKRSTHWSPARQTLGLTNESC
jgi:DNA-formamidopyrimidine glycosylase